MGIDNDERALKEAVALASDAVCFACKGLIDPLAFQETLTIEDVFDISSGRISAEDLRCAAMSMAEQLAKGLH